MLKYIKSLFKSKIKKEYKFDFYWIQSKKPCIDAVIWLKAQKTKSAKTLILQAIKESKLAWCEWALSRSLDKKSNVLWSIYSAESCLYNFEKKYPNDSRPRTAIQAAKNWLKNPSNKLEASVAAWSAEDSKKIRIKSIMFALNLLDLK